MRILLILLTIIALDSCISVNTNGYERLSANDLKHFKPYASEIAGFTKNDPADPVIYEINSIDLKKELKKNKYTWIHLWRPYCTAEACENINYPMNTAAKNNIGYYLVATSYDLKAIKESIERTQYAKPVCILQNSYYKKAGSFNGKTKSLSQLSKEINNNPKLNSKYIDEYFFKDTLLIYTGSPVNKTLLNEHLVDSLLKVYQ